MDIKLNKYTCCDFSNVDKIGVVCRGKSLGSIEKYKKNFKNSFVVGLHVESFKLIGKSFKGSNIVKIWGKTNHRPCEEEKNICSKYKIRDMQTTHSPHLSSRKELKYRKAVNAYNDILKVHTMPLNMKDRNNRIIHKRKLGDGKLSYPTLGLFSVDLASAYQPKEVHVIGLDFYCAPYFAKEKANGKNSTNVKRSPTMLEFFKLLCAEDRGITYHLYTCCDKIKSDGNLIVIRV